MAGGSGSRCGTSPRARTSASFPTATTPGSRGNRLGETRGTAPGAFVDLDGRMVGTHRGVMHYTVGQRRGLGLTATEPLYVLGIDSGRNAVTVGPRTALAAAGLVTGAVNW